MKGYWHFPAIAALIAFICMYFEFPLLFIGLLMWLAYLYYDGRLLKLSFILSVASFFFFYFFLPPITTAEPETQTQKPSTERHSFIGEISQPVSYTDEKIEFVLTENTSKQSILVVYFPEKEVPYHETDQLKFGASCVVEGEIELPNTSRNPGQFDYQNYLLMNDVTYQLVVDSLEELNCSGEDFPEMIYDLRNQLISHVKASTSKDISQWLNGIVFGDDSGLDEETAELFERWGLTHIIAISGLNMGIIVAMTYFVLVKMNILTKEKAAWLLVFMLPVYALVAGGEPSVWRASLMVVAFILLHKLKVRLSVTDVISIVFLLLLFFDKYIIYQVGFQLSFVVTFGLLLSRKWFMQTNAAWIQVLQVTFVSQIMIIPLQFAYFFTFQPLSILINVLIVPYFSIFVIPLMYITVLVSFLPQVFIQFIELFFIPIHDTVISFIAFVDDHFYFPWMIGDFPFSFAVIYYCLFFVFMHMLQSQKKTQAFISGCLLTLVITILALRPYLSPYGTVTMLDIGQGDAFVIELPHRQGVIMIDAGARVSFDDGETETTDSVYKQIIEPFLQANGIQKIDALFLTHEDKDHVGSVPYLTENIETDTIFVSDYYEMTEEGKQIIRENDIQLKRIGAGNKINIKDQVFYVLAPSENHGTVNENSLVLHTNLGGSNWLFTGDIAKEQEREVIQTFPSISADVLKIAHHGSNTSTDPHFLEHTAPEAALISVGENNMYGHPAQEVIDLLEEDDVFILRTDLHGAVQYRFHQNKGTFYTYLP